MKCNAKFFGMKELPKLVIDDDTLRAIADESVSKGLTIAGVQKKLSLQLTDESNARLTLVGYPAGYILKPKSNEYPMLPESEDLTMDMAAICGITTVPHALIEIQDGELAYITKRIDRDGNKKYAMEDFCQISGRLTEDKYKSSYEQCVKIIKNYSGQPGLDLSEFILRIIFCFVTGNSDMHLKNFSLIKKDDAGTYKLSDAYDLLPVQLIDPLDTEETALTMLGKKRNFTRNSFIQFSDTAGISKKVAENMINKVVSCENKFYDAIDKSYLTNDFKDNYKQLVKERIERLK